MPSLKYAHSHIIKSAASSSTSLSCYSHCMYGTDTSTSNNMLASVLHCRSSSSSSLFTAGAVHTRQLTKLCTMLQLRHRAQHYKCINSIWISLGRDSFFFPIFPFSLLRFAFVVRVLIALWLATKYAKKKKMKAASKFMDDLGNLFAVKSGSINAILKWFHYFVNILLWWTSKGFVNFFLPLLLASLFLILGRFDSKKIV